MNQCCEVGCMRSVRCGGRCGKHYRSYRYASVPEFKKQVRIFSKGSNDRLKLLVISVYCGSKIGCQCPGCFAQGLRFLKFLTIDHMDDAATPRAAQNGRKLTGCRLFALIKRLGFPSGFQVLCSACNSSKGRYQKCFESGTKH
jgi:hypothetical protein